jgi:ABC-type Zn uptake system ZnuABC Zn-binding protein ZnuA
MFKGQEQNENTKTLLTTYPGLQTIELHKLDNITDAERSEKKDYVSIMKDNLELIKKELYQ